MSRFGDLAAQDGYDVPAETPWYQPFTNVAKGLARDIPAAGQWFLNQARKPEAEAQADVRGVMGGLAEQLYTLPERTMGASETMRTEGTYNPAPAVETALTMMGGGVAGTGEKAGATLAAGYDPKLWHGVSQIKLPKPVSEMSSILRPVNPAAETVISPAKLQNSMLMPLLGDRTASAAMLERVNGFPFENAVPLQGGHGYMANNPEMAWAAGKSIAPGIAKVAREGAESGLPVHGVYTAMGERSADFSHMVSDTLSEMAKHTKITPEGEKIFNETMRKVSPGFPGINDPSVAQYLRDAPGAVRNVFAKTMDTAPMQKHGFPSVAEARVAVTDPRLLDEPTGASGLSIARMDPKGTLGPSGHATYDTGIAGKYIGGLPASIPKEVMFPDIVGPLSKHADTVAQTRADAGLKPFRPTEDYLMSRIPKGMPKLQEANQEWVDRVSQHLIDRGFTLGAGATDKKTAGAIQGIRAYHSSPHDFDKFDLSKIGTGEGAQVYGHGLYFAENPAVSGQGGQYWESFLNHPSLTPGQQHAGSRLRAEGFDKEKAIAATQRDVNDWMNPEAFPGRDLKNDTYAQKMLALRQAELEALQSGKAGPRTYEVNINADPAHMLDWDTRIGQQTPAVQDYFRKQIAQFGPEASMEAQYKIARSRAKGGGVELSAGMNEAGIPGIKYLDQGSRGSGYINGLVSQYGSKENALAVARQKLADTKEPFMRDTWQKAIDQLQRVDTSNYVVFDPSIIDITKKYAVPGALGAGGMGALAAQDQYGRE